MVDLEDGCSRVQQKNGGERFVLAAGFLFLFVREFLVKNGESIHQQGYYIQIECGGGLCKNCMQFYWLVWRQPISSHANNDFLILKCLLHD